MMVESENADIKKLMRRLDSTAAAASLWFKIASALAFICFSLIMLEAKSIKDKVEVITQRQIKSSEDIAGLKIRVKHIERVGRNK